MATVEELKLYAIGMEYPTILNDPSPVLSLLAAEDAQRTTRNIRNAHRHVGLVLHYDAVSHVAVIFLGTSSPTQPQRLVPWEGTPRKPFQTTESLQSVGGDFRRFPGYLNFTHAIRVIVWQPGAVTSGTYPGLACVTAILDRGTTPPAPVDICLAPSQVELLKALHASYWSGDRYSAEGVLICGDVIDNGDGEGGDGDGDVIDGGDGDGGDGGDNHGGEPASGQGEPKRKRKCRTRTDENIRAENSYKLARALAWEEFHNHQITMVDGEASSVDMDRLPKCVLVPLTEEDLQRGEFSAYESSVGFPWERELSSPAVPNSPALQVRGPSLEDLTEICMTRKHEYNLRSTKRPEH